MQAIRVWGRCLTVLLVTLSVGIAFQLVVTFAVPSIQEAFLDGGTFRSWAGFGLRETICLSGLLSIVMFTFSTESRGHSSRVQRNFVQLAMGCSLGSLISLVVVYLALRLPMHVANFWGIQTLLQITAAGMSASWLATRRSQMSAIASIIAILTISVCLGTAYLIPTPSPDETIMVSVPGVGEVAVDCFFPDGDGPYPAVVILHGVEGATNLTRRAVHYPNAKAVSEKGYATFLVRYFDAFPYEHLMKWKDGVLDIKEIEKTRVQDFRGWIETACAAMNVVNDRDDVGEMAVIGYSLGCYVGSAASSQTSKRGYPEAFVGNFGGIWPEIEVSPTFPPSRFYHGELDSVVPLSSARQGIAKLRDAGISDVELFTYPDQGHLPEGPTLSVIRTNTEAFLQRHLIRAGPDEAN